MNIYLFYFCFMGVDLMIIKGRVDEDLIFELQKLKPRKRLVQLESIY